MEITWIQTVLLYLMIVVSSPLERPDLQGGKLLLLIPIVIFFKLAGG